MTLNIYLAAREAAGFSAYGHASLILWDDVAKTGRTIGANQNSAGLLDMLAYVDLPNEVPDGEDPNNFPDKFDSDKFDTLNKTPITGLGEASAVWAQLIAHANGLDAVYGYDLVAGGSR